MLQCSNQCFQFSFLQWDSHFSSLLKCAEEHHLPKRLNSEYGGGLKEFVRCEENKFEGFENENEFFTMQERQWLILRLLETLRTRSIEEIGSMRFLEGQAISNIFYWKLKFCIFTGYSKYFRFSSSEMCIEWNYYTNISGTWDADVEVFKKDMGSFCI